MTKKVVTKKNLEEFLKKKLRTSDQWARYALLITFNNQTQYEQTTGSSITSNNVGFSAYDAEFFTNMFKKMGCKGHLTQEELTDIKKGISKYWKQVMRLLDIGMLKSLYLEEYGQLSLFP